MCSSLAWGEPRRAHRSTYLLLHAHSAVGRCALPGSTRLRSIIFPIAKTPKTAGRHRPLSPWKGADGPSETSGGATAMDPRHERASPPGTSIRQPLLACLSPLHHARQWPSLPVLWSSFPVLRSSFPVLRSSLPVLHSGQRCAVSRRQSSSPCCQVAEGTSSAPFALSRIVLLCWATMQVVREYSGSFLLS